MVVGGVAGGASAAAKARRVNEHAEIHVFERGPYISFANCGLPYHISGEIVDRSQLIVMTPERFKTRSEIHAHVGHEVLSIERARKIIVVRGPDGVCREEFYDKLVLSQGARPFVPGIPRVELSHVFTLRDIPDMDRIVTALERDKPERAVVIGGGFIGLEMAEAFIHRGMHVTIVEKNPHILPLMDADMARFLQEALPTDRLSFHFNATATRFTPKAVHFADGAELQADLVLVSAGARAEVELAKSAGLELGPTGGVRTNGRMETSDPDIYAVGDAAETIHVVTGARTRIALAGPANRQGRIAGANAAGARLNYPGALGTSIVRILNMTAGFTGLSSKQAAAAGFSFFTSLTRDFSHAHYYPGAKPLLIKVVAEEGTGRLLGAQLLGEAGVDKRLDVLATALTARMSVFDLETLDLAYAPPFGSANDPINTAAFVAGHIARGDIASVPPENWRPAGELLLDVRDADEVLVFGKLTGAIHIPLAQLRSRAGELPRDRRIVTYCQKGQRGYFAACALEGLGFGNVCNLRGGFLQARANGFAVEPAA
ncbi:MAG: sulfur reductase/Rhodanese-related sulfurtransferase [Verrucomicrobia bacterium]|nr:MAG: sulfur reductase/Rhodanese-related sulfurtransferase [Verrucomicrobiota bacterium]